MAFADDYFFPALFMARMGRQRGFSEERIREAHEKLEEALRRLEHQLEGRRYLVGEYTLADISHAGNFHRLRELVERGEVSLGRCPNVAAWMGRVESRESYKAST
jgi:glutathione S-transferase